MRQILLIFSILFLFQNHNSFTTIRQLSEDDILMQNNTTSSDMSSMHMNNDTIMNGMQTSNSSSSNMSGMNMNMSNNTNNNM